MNYKQFELYYINLNSTKWSEQFWIRPCIILQTNAVSDLWKTTIIAILTTKWIEKIYPYEILIKKDNINNLYYDSKIKLDQIRVVDKTRIWKKIWEIQDKKIIDNIFKSIDILFDKPWYFR